MASKSNTLGKIAITLNGEPIKISPCTLLELIINHNIKRDAVIVEINNTIISNKDYEKTKVSDKDTIEIIRYIGGGKY